MSAERIEKVEDEMKSLQKVLYKLEASLENIEKNISQSLSINSTVITHEEKLKVTENRLKNLEDQVLKLKENQISINIKIAVA